MPGCSGELPERDAFRDVGIASMPKVVLRDVKSEHDLLADGTFFIAELWVT